MLEKMTESQYSRFREAVREHCPYRHHMCDGRPIIRGGKKMKPCPYSVNGVCNKREIAEIRMHILHEIEERGYVK